MNSVDRASPIRAEAPPAGAAAHDAATDAYVSGAAAKPSGRGYDCRVLASVAEVPLEIWTRLMPGDPESWDFYSAAEGVPPPGFKLGAIIVSDADTILAAAPLFRVDYRIDTPFQGRLRKLGDWVYSRAPRLVSFPVIGLGSPMSDACALGFAPGLCAGERVAVFDAMLAGLQREAKARHSALIAVKSIGAEAVELAAPLARHGYNRVTTVPVAIIDLPFRSLDEYLASLPKKDRKYLARKQRSAEKVRVEVRSSIAGLEDRLNALFQGTLAESKVDYGDFEQLHPDYLGRLSRSLGDGAVFMLYWLGDDLVGFELSLVGRDRILSKHIGMRYPLARELDLYFVSGLKLIELAIARGIPRIELGATTYTTKLLFGARLERRWLCYRFRGGLANRALRGLSPLFDFERNDPELKKLLADRGGEGEVFRS